MPNFFVFSQSTTDGWEYFYYSDGSVYRWRIFPEGGHAELQPVLSKNTYA